MDQRWRATDYQYYIYYSEQDQCYVGTVKEIPSLESTGKTSKEAFQNIQQSVQSVLSQLYHEDVPTPIQFS